MEQNLSICFPSYISYQLKYLDLVHKQKENKDVFLSLPKSKTDWEFDGEEGDTIRGSACVFVPA